MIEDTPCGSFAYAAYLPPGLHQFLIYIPGRIIKIPSEPRTSPAPAGGKEAMVIPARLFCKSITINLAENDFYPFIRPFQKEKKKVKTISNVWRRWRHDTDEDMETAFQKDIVEGFDPTLFMKDQADIDAALQILVKNFKMIQIWYIEGLAQTYSFYKSYPEISYFVFTKMVLSIQTEAMQKRLPSAMIDLAFQRATRGDEGQTLQGTLCRGEFQEILLRLTRQ